MFWKYFKRLGLPFLVLCLLVGVWHLHRPFAAGETVAAREIEASVVLVPLDGRPPCKDFVINAGKIAGLGVLTPPSELQDYYSMAGDTAGMRAWLRENLPGKRAAIISIDQLLYGGLLAAREKNANAEEIAALVKYLRELKSAAPDVPLLAFSILPRQTPQDSIDGYEERKNLLAYSRLVGRQAAGEEIDEAALTRLREAIPVESLAAYLKHFEENEALNRELVELAREGVITRLVLGQDDGEKYSIPNIEKERLRSFIEESGASSRVALAHGADELALTLLAEVSLKSAGLTPKIYIDYNAPTSREAILPFMAVSMEETAEERVRLLGGELVSTVEEADLVLFVSAGDSERGTLSQRGENAAALKKYVEAGKGVALVDLSAHFQASETLLPSLLESRFPLSSLYAYAGWNTASNSVGTALAEAALYLSALKDADEGAALSAAHYQAAFLHERVLEDYFYLKGDIDDINRALKKAGYKNTADLDLEHNYRWANAMLDKTLASHLAAYKNEPAVREPYRVRYAGGEATVYLNDLTTSAYFPWPRTFEINLKAAPVLVKTSP